MKVYNAIMKAADHIERHPELFNFIEVRVPDCKTPACAAGWISHFMGHEPVGQGITSGVTDVAFDTPYGVFTSRMDILKKHVWRFDPKICADTMRLYAETYHSQDKLYQRTDKELVADLMTKVMGERISEDA